MHCNSKNVINLKSQDKAPIYQTNVQIFFVKNCRWKFLIFDLHLKNDFYWFSSKWSPCMKWNPWKRKSIGIIFKVQIKNEKFSSAIFNKSCEFLVVTKIEFLSWLVYCRVHSVSRASRDFFKEAEERISRKVWTRRLHKSWHHCLF